MLQNIGSFLKTWEKNWKTSYANISTSISASIKVRHILVSSCYNSYGVLETSRNSWTGIKIGDSPWNSTWHVDSRCWHHTLFSPPYCKKLWGVSLFYMFFLGTKILFAILWLTPTDENPDSKKAAPTKINQPCPFRILDP